MPPCTARKSTARKSAAGGRFHDTRWVATATPMDLVTATNEIKANAGSSAQNSAPKARSKPGQSATDMPIHGASATRWVS